MQIPDNVYATLEWICSEYPWPVVQEEYHIGEILNFVAYQHRNKGWGLSRKTSGKHVDSPVGAIAEDILQLPDGNHFDVLGGIDVGQPLRPGQASTIGIINLRDRPWVEPVDWTPRWLNPVPEPQPVPPPVEEPTPTPAPLPVPPVCQCNYNERKLDEVAKRVEDLALHFDGILQDVLVRLDRNFNKESGGKCVFRR